MTMQTIAMFVLVAAAIGGVAWVFVYPLLSGERQAEKRTRERRAAPSRAAPRDRRARRRNRAASRSRRRSRSSRPRRKKPKSLPLRCSIAQAGLTWSKHQFMIISARARASVAFLCSSC